MRKAIVLLLAALGVAACAKDRPAENANVTTIRSGVPEPSRVNIEEVRTVLLAKNPAMAEHINRLVISSEGGVVTLKGKIGDEATRGQLVNQVRAMPHVRGVRDELKIDPKLATRDQRQPGAVHGRDEPVGTTTTTGATVTRPEAIRNSMRKAHPQAEEVIKGLIIADDGTIITVTGVVPNEEMRKSLLKAAKETPGVNDVRDEMKVGKREGADRMKGKEPARDSKGRMDQRQQPKQQPTDTPRR